MHNITLCSPAVDMREVYILVCVFVCFMHVCVLLSNEADYWQRPTLQCLEACINASGANSSRMLDTYFSSNKVYTSQSYEIKLLQLPSVSIYRHIFTTTRWCTCVSGYTWTVEKL